MRYTLSLSIFLWNLVLFSSCQAQVIDAVPAHDSFKLRSAVLEEVRTVNVWLPEAYESDTSSFPVMYMLDGGIKEDFPHLANTVASLIAQDKIPPLILVGIENTRRKKDLTGHTSVAKDRKLAPEGGGSGAFRNFVRDELIPEINRKYRTTSERSIIGESLAGLFVVETFLLAPDLFNNYIAFDPSLWWNDHQLVKSAEEQFKNFPDKDLRLWFAASDAKDIYRNTDNFSEKLKKASLPNLQWTYSREPNEQHSTIFRATKEKALIWSFNK